MNTLCWRSPLGPILLEEEGGAVTGLRFCGQEVPAQGPVSPVLAQAAAQLAEYFAGQRQSFTIPLAPRGTLFQQEVWLALCAIPYGQTRSYGQLAAALGRPSAARAVGGACRRNPIWLMIPCHRVVGASAASPATPAAWSAKKPCWRWSRARLCSFDPTKTAPPGGSPGVRSYF